jgi:hypothetical protein
VQPFPNAPAPHQPAAMHYARDPAVREQLRGGGGGGGGHDPRELAKLMGAAWKAMDEEGRRPWLELAEEDRERYERERAAYERSEEHAFWSRRQPSALRLRQHEAAMRASGAAAVASVLFGGRSD